jgi:hypothetical protein
MHLLPGGLNDTVKKLTHVSTVLNAHNFRGFNDTVETQIDIKTWCFLGSFLSKNNNNKNIAANVIIIF